MDPRLTKAAEYWSNPVATPARTRWWQSKLICRHINRNYCGKEVDGTDGGDIEVLRKVAGGKMLERAVSVGCGNAYHELSLLQANVVGTFHLYELSPVRAEEARKGAQARGLSERVVIHVADAFAATPVPAYDLVYWKDSLHHMLDARAAVAWSRQVLVRGGVFFMNEFVGPTHMQYTDRQLDLAEKVRKALPDKYLLNPHDPGRNVPFRRARPNLEKLLEVDPTECADSENILPSVRDLFPGVAVTPTGGVVYMLALNDILANMDEVGDATLLHTMMLADDLCIEAGETLYAVAHAVND